MCGVRWDGGEGSARVGGQCRSAQEVQEGVALFVRADDTEVVRQQLKQQVLKTT